MATVTPFEHPQVRAEDRWETPADGVHRLVRTFLPRRPTTVVANRLWIEVVSEYAPSRLMIPAVSYDGNRWGDGKGPTGWDVDGTPWSFAFHRSAVPGGSFSTDGRHCVGVFGERDRSSSAFSCSLFPRDGRAVHRLIAPEEEMPRSYLTKGSLDEGYRDTVLLHPDRPVTLSAVITLGTPGYHRFLDTAWDLHARPVAPAHADDALWRLGITYAKDHLWTRTGAFAGFSIGLMHDDRTGDWEAHTGYESGWCGQNVSLGCSLLYDHLRTGDADSLERGLACLDAWADAFLPSGMFCPHYDALLGLRPMEGLRIDSCNLGGSAENFIEAAELAHACGRDGARYLRAAERILRTCRDHQQDDGSFPAAYDVHAEVMDTGGSTGGFVVPAMLWAYAVTREGAYLDSARRAMAFSYDDFTRNGFTTAGALDTHCIDKESAYPLLSAAIMLHGVTGLPAYLDQATEVAYYLSTWQWHHSVEFPPGSALHALGYDTFGGTAVSTQHHHLDAYALRYVPSLLELARRTGQDRWRARAMAAWANASIGVSDGSLVVMGRRRPTGSQDEAFFHTRWGNPFNVSEWLVAWPTALRLEVLRKTQFFSRTTMGDGVRV